MTDDFNLDELPEQIKEIVSVIGIEDTIRLTNVYGGMTIRFSDESSRDVGTRRDIIERLLGKKKAPLFFKHFANRALYIARCTNALKGTRDRQIRTDSDVMQMAELILKWGLSERQIWRILKASAI